MPGHTLNLTSINRVHMGAYQCFADNGVPVAANATFYVEVHCKYMLYDTSIHGGEVMVVRPSPQPLIFFHSYERPFHIIIIIITSTATIVHTCTTISFHIPMTILQCRHSKVPTQMQTLICSHTSPPQIYIFTYSVETKLIAFRSTFSFISFANGKQFDVISAVRAYNAIKFYHSCRRNNIDLFYNTYIL